MLDVYNLSALLYMPVKAVSEKAVGAQYSSSLVVVGPSMARYFCSLAQPYELRQYSNHIILSIYWAQRGGYRGSKKKGLRRDPPLNLPSCVPAPRHQQASEEPSTTSSVARRSPRRRSYYPCAGCAGSPLQPWPLPSAESAR